MYARTKDGRRVRLYTSSMGEPMLSHLDAERLFGRHPNGPDATMIRAARELEGWHVKGLALGAVYLYRAAR